MDEKDFAELISVFLKGNESDEIAGTRELNVANITQDEANLPSEAEIRKNIIEALADRIKESGDAQPAEETPSEPPVETASDDKEHAHEMPSLQNAIEELVTNIASESIKEELVTKEEVAKLLNDAPLCSSALQQTLGFFTDLDGVKSALVITRDGFAVDYTTNVEFDVETVSATVATGFAAFEKIGHDLGQGDLQIAMLEYDDGPVLVSPLTHGAALVIVASQWTTLGRIRLEIKKRFDALVEAL